jgi:hypothetical protein
VAGSSPNDVTVPEAHAPPGRGQAGSCGLSDITPVNTTTQGYGVRPLGPANLDRTAPQTSTDSPANLDRTL